MAGLTTSGRSRRTLWVALAIFLDSTVVWALLVPSLMKVLGGLELVGAGVGGSLEKVGLLAY